MVTGRPGLIVLLVFTVTTNGVLSLPGGLGDQCRNNWICDDLNAECNVASNVCTCRQGYQRQGGQCITITTTTERSQVNEQQPENDGRNGTKFKQLLDTIRRNALIANVSGKLSVVADTTLISTGSVNKEMPNRMHFSLISTPAIQANTTMSAKENDFRNFADPWINVDDENFENISTPDLKDIDTDLNVTVSTSGQTIDEVNITQAPRSENVHASDTENEFSDPLLNSGLNTIASNTTIARFPEFGNNASDENVSLETESAIADGLVSATNPDDVGSVEMQTPDSGLSAGKTLACYYSSWALDRHGLGRFLPSDFDAHLCTHLIYAFITIGNDFRLEMTNSFADQYLYNAFNALKLKNYFLITMISVNGWTQKNGLVVEMVSNAEHRMQFIDSCVKLLRTWGFDGLEIDMEYLLSQGWSESHMDNFVTLLKDLNEAFTEEAASSGWPKLFLSLAVTAKNIGFVSNNNLKGLDRYARFISLMAFDLRETSIKSVKGPSFKDFQKTVVSAASILDEVGITKSSIIVGLPAFGRTYTLGDPRRWSIGSPAVGPGILGEYTRESGFLSYYEICRVADAPNVNRCRDADSREPFVISGNQLVGYEDTESLTYKINWIRVNGFGGLMIWSLDLDDFHSMCRSSQHPFPLTRLLRDGLREPILPPVSSDAACGQESASTENSTTAVQDLTTSGSLLDTNVTSDRVGASSDKDDSKSNKSNEDTTPIDDYGTAPLSGALDNPFFGTNSNSNGWTDDASLQGGTLENDISNKDRLLTDATITNDIQQSNNIPNIVQSPATASGSMGFDAETTPGSLRTDAPFTADQITTGTLGSDSDLASDRLAVDNQLGQDQVPSVNDTAVVDGDYTDITGDDFNDAGTDFFEEQNTVENNVA